MFEIDFGRRCPGTAVRTVETQLPSFAASTARNRFEAEPNIHQAGTLPVRNRALRINLLTCENTMSQQPHEGGTCAECSAAIGAGKRDALASMLIWPAHAMSWAASVRSFPWKAHLERMCRHPYQIGSIRKDWHAILSK